MKPAKIGINGFGRMGSLTFRASLLNPQKATVTHINNPFMTIDDLLYLLKYDSAHGRLNNTSLKKISDSKFSINSQEILFTNHESPADIDWSQTNIYSVLDCTGKFLTS